MKIKDKISGEVYEAETWKSWNGVVKYVKKGTNGPIRSGDDVEIIEDEKPKEPKDTTDWDAFRREAAKDILCALVGNKDYLKVIGRIEPETMLAIRFADELCKQLKEEKK